jgi:hypothetical protein
LDILTEAKKDFSTLQKCKIENKNNGIEKTEMK